MTGIVPPCVKSSRSAGGSISSAVRAQRRIAQSGGLKKLTTSMNIGCFIGLNAEKKKAGSKTRGTPSLISTFSPPITVHGAGCVGVLGTMIGANIMSMSLLSCVSSAVERDHGLTKRTDACAGTPRQP